MKHSILALAVSLTGLWCAMPASAAGQDAPVAAARRGLAATPDRSEQATPASEIFRIGASARFRTEVKDDSKFGAPLAGNDEQYLLTQLRVSATWTPASRVAVFVEIQDARIFGEEGINQDAIPNIFSDELDLHQASLRVDLSSDRLPMSVTLGRQKFTLGAQRLVSPLEWVNTARVWDGIRLDLGRSDERTLNVFASRLVPVSPQDLNWHDLTGNRMFDSYFYGAYFTEFGSVIVGDTEVEGRVEPYWFLRHQSDASDAVHTVGARLTATIGSWDASVELAAQFGKWGDDTQRGKMVHSALGYTFAGQSATRLGVGYNYGSGDSNPSDGTHETFDNLYPLNHAFYGYMDFFALQNLHNIEATFDRGIGAGIRARVAYHSFWLVEEDTDAWYNAGAGTVRQATQDVASHVGSEIDVTVRRSFWQGRISAEAGYGLLLTGEYVRDTGPSSDSGFFYLQARISR